MNKSGKTVRGGTEGRRGGDGGGGRGGDDYCAYETERRRPAESFTAQGFPRTHPAHALRGPARSKCTMGPLQARFLQERATEFINKSTKKAAGHFFVVVIL